MMIRRTGGVFEGVDVVLLHEAFDERLLEHAEVGGGQLEDLRRPLPGDEEGCLWVFVHERLALVHCPLCAGIFGLAIIWSAAGYMVAVFPGVPTLVAT